MSTQVAAAHRRADIQGLRAVAVVLVVAFHAGLPIPGGFLGVDVFFVISGFVITGLLLREFSSAGRLNLRRFYARRFRRLIPALALVVTATVLLAVPLQSPFGAQQVTAKTGIGAMLLVANAVIYQVSGGYFDGPAELNALLNTWSLSVEEQFYILFPAVLVLGWWIGRRRSSQTGAVVLVSLLVAASFAMGMWFTFAQQPIGFIERPAQFAFYSSLTRAWEFGVGALLALASTRWQAEGRLGAALGLAGAVLMILSVALIDATVPFPGWAALPPVLATLLLIAAGPSSPTGRALGVGLMVWIGGLSYSWYLWHWPLIVFAQGLFPRNAWVLVAAGIGSLIPAWLAYRFVENPIRNGSGRLAFPGRRLALLVLLSVGIPIAASLLLLRGADALWGESAVRAMANQVVPLPISTNAGCSTEVPLGLRASGECTWNGQASGPPVYLVGDSQAGMLSDGMLQAATVLRRPLRVAESGSCPFVLQDASTIPLTSDSCQAFVAGNVDYLATAPRGTVVIAIAPGYLTPDSVGAFGTALNRTIAAVQEQGHKVVLVQAVPQFPDWTPWNCTLIAAWTDSAGCGESLPESELRQTWALALQMFDSVAKSRGVPLLDLWPELCLDGQCSTNRGATWDYRDARHISVGKSLELTPVLTAAVSSARMSP